MGHIYTEIRSALNYHEKNASNKENKLLIQLSNINSLPFRHTHWLILG